jgi:hypothetical protein
MGELGGWENDGRAGADKAVEAEEGYRRQEDLVAYRCFFSVLILYVIVCSIAILRAHTTARLCLTGWPQHTSNVKRRHQDNRKNDESLIVHARLLDHLLL